MANVFISHSSRDKRFVRKLATALLSEGFPVWLDSWELELGDSLLDKIYDGIESSSVMILVVSQHSIESGWVNRELNAALSMETQAGRTFLVPVIVDDTKIPLKISDRLYVDFSSTFSEPLAVLTDAIGRLGCRGLDVPPERELIPLRFTNEVHLDMGSLSNSLRHIQQRHNEVKVSAGQIVVNDDDEYTEIQRRLHARIDNVASDEFFSPKLERVLRGTLVSVQESNSNLTVGVSLMLTQGCSVDAVYWFARIVRGNAAYSLWSAQTPGDPDLLQYGQKWSCANINKDSDACKFFDTERVEAIHLWHPSYNTTPFSLWIGTDAIRAPLCNEQGVYLGPDAVFNVCTLYARQKYIEPQMVLQHLTEGTSPVLWRLDAAVVGLR